MTDRITIVGTVATDPKLITTKSGVDLCSFRLASSSRHFDREKQEWVDGLTSWYGVSVFRSMADHALRSFRKGERVIVHGRLRVRTWESGEKRGTSVDVEAEALGHDVRWGVSRFERQPALLADSARSPSEDTGSGASDTTPLDEDRSVSDSHAGSDGGDGFLPVAA